MNLKFKIALSTSILLIFFFANTVISGEQSSRNINTKDDFSITLPTNWIEIPQEEIHTFLKEINETSKVKLSISIDYGYQRQLMDEWFQHPYIFLMVNKKGRIAEGDLKNIKKMDSLLNEELTKVRGYIPGFILSSKLEEIVYEPDSYILWNLISLYFEGVGTVKQLSATLLTKEGYLMVNCFSKEKDFVHDVDIFQEFIRNITLKDSLKYKPN